MNVLKQIGLWLSVLLMPFALYGLATSLAVVQVFGEPTKLKGLLADSKIYETVADSVIKDQLHGNEESNVNLDDPRIEALTKKAIPPDTIRGLAGQIIDSTYGWLEGKSATPDFNIDLSPIKQHVASSLGQQAGEKVSSLPACTLAQLRELNPEMSAFDLPCRPPGVTAAIASQQASNEFLNDSRLSGNNNFSAQDLSKDSEGKTIFEQASALPAVYQLFKKAPWIFGIGSFILALSIIFLSQTRRKGVNKLSVILLIVGVILLITSWIAKFIINLDPTVRNISVLTDKIFQSLLIFGVTYLAVGIVALIALRVTRTKVQG